MKIYINNKKIVEDIISKEVVFPYYAWYSEKKESIIKMYPQYYKYTSKLQYIIIIKIIKDWNVDTQIIKDHIVVLESDRYTSIIDEKIQTYLTDYWILATEEEFLKFRQQAIEDLL